MRRATAGIVVIAAAIVAAAATPALAAEKYALVVGVNEYLPKELPSLKYADAEAVAVALDKLGFSVVTMTSRAGVAFRPTTADKIVAQAARWLEDREPGDTVVIALSGHGVEFKGDGDFYFCPSEAKVSSRDSLVLMSRLMREIGGCRAGRKLLLSDACRDELPPEAAGKPVAVGIDSAGVFRVHPPVPRRASKPRVGDARENSLGMKLVVIPAGEFEMGGRETADQLKAAGFSVPDGYDTSDERPVHQVKITKPFLMGVHEVTLGEFLTFYNDGFKGKLEAEKDGMGGFGYEAKNADKPFKQKPEYRPWNWGHPGMDLSTAVGRERAFRHPVVNVSWNDCVSFCEWLSRKEGKKYRLPTEAEWEYACRAGTTTRFWNGDGPEELAAIGNVADAAFKAQFGFDWPIRGRDGHAFTSPVGSSDRTNAFGLHDMHGSLFEWCNDCYNAEYYSQFANNVAVDPSGPSSVGLFRVIRGGCWREYPVGCRSAYRDYDSPTYRDSDIGFRVVCELE
jgi:sulfatase modifying factor 1